MNDQIPAKPKKILVPKLILNEKIEFDTDHYYFNCVQNSIVKTIEHQFQISLNRFNRRNSSER